jgi:hypothetical protein
MLDGIGVAASLVTAVATVAIALAAWRSRRKS